MQILYIFLFPLTFSSLPWLQNKTFCSFMHHGVGSSLETFYSREIPPRGGVRGHEHRYRGGLWLFPGVWRDTFILMTEMHLILTLKDWYNQRFKFNEEYDHDWSYANNDHQCDWDTDDFACISDCPQVTLPPAPAIVIVKEMKAKSDVQFDIGWRIWNFYGTAWKYLCWKILWWLTAAISFFLLWSSFFSFCVRLICDWDLLA